MAWICSAGNGAFASKLSRKWVRFRSGSPAGAMRSSTCTKCTDCQGTSSFARARSICHGVRPPLTAMMKRPRVSTAPRASAAMILAASWATALASARICIFMAVSPVNSQTFLAIDNRVVPTTGRCDLRDFLRSPCHRFVLADRGARFQYWIDYGPCFFNIVLAGEIRGVPLHRLGEQPLVSVHRIRIVVLEHPQLDRAALHPLARALDPNPERNGDVRADAEAQVVGRR